MYFIVYCLILLCRVHAIFLCGVLFTRSHLNHTVLCTHCEQFTRYKKSLENILSKMNSSSSFELSSGLLEKSYSEYEEPEDVPSDVRFEASACSISEINNPVKKKINELAQLQVNSKLSNAAVKKMIPILNGMDSTSIQIPDSVKFKNKSTEKVFEPEFYVKCFSCKQVKKFPGKCCKKDLKKTQNNYFAYLPIQPQIESSIIKHFEDIIDYSKRKRVPFAFTDIDDGNVQSEINDQFSEQIVLSFTLNIDGGVLSEKSTKSLWPVQLYQNYLPPLKRFAPENIIIAGLYYDQGKPDPYELLFPVLADFRQFFHDKIELFREGNTYTFMPILLHCSCDLPARAQIQNFKSPTGRSACPICLHPGEPNIETALLDTDTSSKKSLRIYEPISKL